MRSTRFKRKAVLSNRDSQPSTVNPQAEERRKRIARIQAAMAEERKAFLALYVQKRDFHDQLREQLEYYLEEERRLLLARESNGLAQ